MVYIKANQKSGGCPQTIYLNIVLTQITLQIFPLSLFTTDFGLRHTQRNGI